ncbi:MAG TPA: tripartite tricarboxylate transporter substrate binding protein [Burkholderiaceae bacterium]|nr:tripartite tricarboxylate transporter substrate binding protein [Burkholderiaceae bacterium]
MRYPQLRNVARLGWSATLATAVAIMPMMASAQQAANYPERSITMVVPFGPGSVTDLLARIVAKGIGDDLGQSVVVHNKAGAGGNIGAAEVANAAPDGYTLLVGPTSTNAVNPTLFKNIKFGLDDFAPISNIATVPNVLVVHPDVPATTVAEFIELSKKRQLSYASTGNGGSMHLSGELFQSMSGADLMHVPYKGGGAALADLLPGRVDAMFCNLPLCLPHIESGKLRALGVTSRQASSLLPDVAPIAENGLPGYEVTGWFGLFAPAKVDPAIIDKLNASLMKTLNDEGIKQQLLAQGAETDGSSPAEFDQFVRAEHDKWARVIKEAGISIE